MRKLINFIFEGFKTHPGNGMYLVFLWVFIMIGATNEKPWWIGIVVWCVVFLPLWIMTSYQIGKENFRRKMKITRELLEELGACNPGLEWFVERYPCGVELSSLVDALQRENKEIWIGWLASRPSVFKKKLFNEGEKNEM